MNKDKPIEIAAASEARAFKIIHIVIALILLFSPLIGLRLYKQMNAPKAEITVQVPKIPAPPVVEIKPIVVPPVEVKPVQVVDTCPVDEIYEEAKKLSQIAATEPKNRKAVLDRRAVIVGKALACWDDKKGSLDTQSWLRGLQSDSKSKESPKAVTPKAVPGTARNKPDTKTQFSKPVPAKPVAVVAKPVQKQSARIPKDNDDEDDDEDKPVRKKVPVYKAPEPVQMHPKTQYYGDDDAAPEVNPLSVWPPRDLYRNN